jgi:hypothetical protein
VYQFGGLNVVFQKIKILYIINFLDFFFLCQKIIHFLGLKFNSDVKYKTLSNIAKVIGYKFNYFYNPTMM